MPSCAAINCHSRSECRGQRLFCFPIRHEKRLRQWVTNVRRKHWWPNDNSRLCALHFEERCFTFIGGRKCLTPTAVPTIFHYTWKGQSVRGKSAEARLTAPHITDHSYSKSAAQDAEEVLETERVVVMQGPDDGHFVPGDTASMWGADGVKEEPQRIPDMNVPPPSETGHSDRVKGSPHSLKHHMETWLLAVDQKLHVCRRKLKLEKEKNKRLLKKIDFLSEIILKQKDIMPRGCADVTENSFIVLPKEFRTKLTRGKRSEGQLT